MEKNRTSRVGPMTGCLIWFLVIFVGFPITVNIIKFAVSTVKNVSTDIKVQSIVRDVTVGDQKTGGTKFICYNESTEKYDLLYCGDDAPKNGDEVGLIVRYTSTMLKSTGTYYSYNPKTFQTSGSGHQVTWSLETLKVTLVDRATGKTLASKTFVQELPSGYSSDSDFTRKVSEYSVRKWISEVWPDYQRNAG